MHNRICIRSPDRAQNYAQPNVLPSAFEEKIDFNFWRIFPIYIPIYCNRIGWKRPNFRDFSFSLSEYAR